MRKTSHVVIALNPGKLSSDEKPADQSAAEEYIRQAVERHMRTMPEVASGAFNLIAVK